MKNFILYIGIVLTMVISSAYVLDLIYSQLLTRPNKSSTLNRAFYYNNMEFDIVFFGSSRVVNNIDCEIIENITGKSCLNMGSMGSTSRNDAFLFELLLENNNTIKQAYFQVDYKYNDLSLGNSFKADLIPFMGRPMVDRYLKEEKQNPWLIGIPFYRFMNYDKVIGFRKVAVSLIKSDNKGGFIPLKGVGFNNNVELPTSYIKNSNSSLYEQIKGSKNVDFHYFTAPFCQQVENREATKQLNDMFKNYRNYTYFFEENQEYFKDCLHLNSNGAEVFSRQLAMDIIQN